MKAFSVLTPALAVLALSFVACDSKSGTATTTQPSSTQDNTPSGNIDLSQFTPVTVTLPNWVEDWMVPKSGVVTDAFEAIKGQFYSLRVSGVTTADVERYKSVLVEHGMTKPSKDMRVLSANLEAAGPTAFGFLKDNKTYVTFNTKTVVGTTKDSYIEIRIQYSEAGLAK
jgi:hypothetical protein